MPQSSQTHRSWSRSCRVVPHAVLNPYVLAKAKKVCMSGNGEVGTFQPCHLTLAQFDIISTQVKATADYI